MNKGQIYEELRYFQSFLQILSKSNEELRGEIRDFIKFRKALQDESIKLKITQFGSKFKEKSKSKN